MSLHIASYYYIVAGNRVQSKYDPSVLAARKSEKLWHDITHGGDHGYPVAGINGGFGGSWYPLIAHYDYDWGRILGEIKTNSFQKDGLWRWIYHIPRVYPMVPQVS